MAKCQLGGILHLEVRISPHNRLMFRAVTLRENCDARPGGCLGMLHLARTATPRGESQTKEDRSRSNLPTSIIGFLSALTSCTASSGAMSCSTASARIPSAGGAGFRFIHAGTQLLWLGAAPIWSRLRLGQVPAAGLAGLCYKEG